MKLRRLLLAAFKLGRKLKQQIGYAFAKLHYFILHSWEIPLHVLPVAFHWFFIRLFLFIGLLQNSPFTFSYGYMSNLLVLPLEL